jgi:hypothetical protein
MGGGRLRKAAAFRFLEGFHAFVWLTRGRVRVGVPLAG